MFPSLNSSQDFHVIHSQGKDGKKLTRNEIAAKKKEDEAKEAERKKKAEYWQSLTLEEKIGAAAMCTFLVCFLLTI